MFRNICYYFSTVYILKYTVKQYNEKYNVIKTLNLMQRIISRKDMS